MKKWIIAVVCITLSLVLCVGTANFLVVPLMQYRALPSRITYAVIEYDYINPGVAKHSDYDAVLIGTSLAENADMDVYESAFGLPMVRLITPGGTTRNYLLLLDRVYQSHDPKLVLWSIDETLFSQDGSAYNHDMPEYLYDENRLNDVSYLLNLTVFYSYTFKDAAFSLVGRGNRPILRGDVWSKKQTFGKDAVLQYDREKDDVPEDGAQIESNAAQNLQAQILPMLREHPDTQFCFFFPPKCVTYWQAAVRNGTFDARFDAMRDTVRALLECGNARVFFFADRMEWTTDYDLYKDDVHFTQSVNNAMGEAMARGEGELTQNGYAAQLSSCAEALRQAAEEA